MLSPRLVLLLLAIAPSTLPAQDSYSPLVLPASNEPLRAMQGFQPAPGLKVRLFAAEPMLANPVAFCIDEKGRFYVAETFRLHAGVTDNRRHLREAGWLDDELACRTVSDRVAMYRKHLGDAFPRYGTEHERVRVLEDRDGDGKADFSGVFADGFHDYPDGIGAGLLARGNRVWYTCIPELWLLEDADRDGRAERRKVLQEGYGVHTALLGHDLHGLRRGPDGKLYFSVGDRGLNVTTREGKHFVNTGSGAVLRCNMDGSHLEIFATGLRNPQELAFDELGNLFTGDNNSDGGDKARLVYVVEGGDSGWRMSYQYLSDRGPWNREKLWWPHWRGQAAWIVPPIANVTDGPAGFTYYPGTGLADRYRNHFLLCDFRGSSANSGVHALSVSPKGAGFELASFSHFIWKVLATDVDFGPDGRVYLTDWTEGWEQTGKGRIYQVFDPARADDPEAHQTRSLLAKGMARRTLTDLAKLLAHPDMRVRLEAQYALAAKGRPAIALLKKVAMELDHRLARIHAMWGLGQIGTNHALDPLVPLLEDGDGEIRAQAAKVLGEGHHAAAEKKLIARLSDRSSRARFFAAIALGKLQSKGAIPALLEMLAANADEDPFLRHAGVLGLVGANDLGALLAHADDTSPAVRTAILLALRRMRSPQVARFLGDSEIRIVEEAARAIGDPPITAALVNLAAVLNREGLTSEVVLRRAINACARLGSESAVAALAAFAARKGAATSMRVAALDAFARLAARSGRDAVLGDWRPRPKGDRRLVSAALSPILGDLLRTAPDPVRAAAANAAGKLGMDQVMLAKLCVDPKRSAQVRTAAIEALAAIGDGALVKLARRVCEDKERGPRQAALRILTKVAPDAALPVLERLLAKGKIGERQSALAALGDLQGDGATRLLGQWLDRLDAHAVPAAIQLDLLEAAGKRKDAAIAAKLARHTVSLSAQDPSSAEDLLTPYRVCLEGGHKSAGNRVYHENEAAACRRCHVMGSAGGHAGPPLTKIGDRLTREQILEALVAPARRIAPGYGTVVVTTKDGKVHSGLLREEGQDQVKLVDAAGDEIVLARDAIDSRSPAISAMPPVAALLTRSELRDLVAYLASLKTKTKRKPAKAH